MIYKVRGFESSRRMKIGAKCEKIFLDELHWTDNTRLDTARKRNLMPLLADIESFEEGGRIEDCNYTKHITPENH